MIKNEIPPNDGFWRFVHLIIPSGKFRNPMLLENFKSKPLMRKEKIMVEIKNASNITSVNDGLIIAKIGC